MISIIIPVYNSEKYLVECIESVLNQSYKDIELILVNDGSTDNSLSICQSFDDGRIRIINQVNAGVSSARNAGLEVAQGDYLTFVDSDDTLPSDALLTLLNEIENNSVDFSLGSFMFQYGEKLMPHSPRLKSGIYQFKDVLPTFIDDGTLSGFLVGSVCGGLYKTEIIRSNSIRFITAIKNNEDGLFNFEYAMNAASLAVTSAHVYHYRKYSSSSSGRRLETYDFNRLIKDYIFERYGSINELNLDGQFKTRAVSLALWDLLKYPQSMSMIKGSTYIRNRLKDSGVREGIQLICPGALSKYKKVFFYLMKYRCSYTLYFLVCYIIPRVSSHISR